LVRANYNDLQKGVHATTKFLEMFFSNLILGTEYELKNRTMHIDYVNDDDSQSAISKAPRCQIDTLGCTLEELAVLELIIKNPSVKQAELVTDTGKSLRSIKRIMESLQKKQYIRRVNGKRYGTWEVLIKVE
jgi:predicted HTH transcriptional regulator